MRQLNVRHPLLHEIAQGLLDLFPSNADVSEVGPDLTPSLFVSWRTSGVANHPGNVAWGVHYRFDPQLLRAAPEFTDESRLSACDRVREMSRHLRFDYADPRAISLFVVDVPAAVFDA
jgi:hypothetical protein